MITQPPGYRLAVDRRSVDVFRFEALVDEGRARLLDADAAARAILDEALSLWAGPPLPELAGEPFVVAMADRLLATRARAVEAAAEARLALGDHAGAIVVLEQEAPTHPLHERLHGLLAVGLYRAAGRPTPCASSTVAVTA